jgi:hypothetical protein
MFFIVQVSFYSSKYEVVNFEPVPCIISSFYLTNLNPNQFTDGITIELDATAKS